MSFLVRQHTHTYLISHPLIGYKIREKHELRKCSWYTHMIKFNVSFLVHSQFLKWLLLLNIVESYGWMWLAVNNNIMQNVSYSYTTMLMSTVRQITVINYRQQDPVFKSLKLLTEATRFWTEIS